MIITGHPTIAETAAVVAVLTARSQEPDQADQPPRSAWADRSRLLRPPVHPGPGAWRASALPR